MSGMPRMRTLPEALKAIQSTDPDTCLTLTALRRMVKQGQIPTIEIGTKRLVNLDSLMDMLSNPQMNKTAHEPMGGIIRAVPERIDKQWTTM